MILETPAGYFAHVPGAAVPLGPYRTRAIAERVLANIERRRARAQNPKGPPARSMPLEPRPVTAPIAGDKWRGGSRRERRREATVKRNEARSAISRAKLRAKRPALGPRPRDDDPATHAQRDQEARDA